MTGEGAGAEASPRRRLLRQSHRSLLLEQHQYVAVYAHRWPRPDVRENLFTCNNNELKEAKRLLEEKKRINCQVGRHMEATWRAEGSPLVETNQWLREFDEMTMTDVSVGCLRLCGSTTCRVQPCMKKEKGDVT